MGVGGLVVVWVTTSFRFGLLFVWYGYVSLVVWGCSVVLVFCWLLQAVVFVALRTVWYAFLFVFYVLCSSSKIGLGG